MKITSLKDKPNMELLWRFEVEVNTIFEVYSRVNARSLLYYYTLAPGIARESTHVRTLRILLIIIILFFLGTSKRTCESSFLECKS